MSCHGVTASRRHAKLGFVGRELHVGTVGVLDVAGHAIVDRLEELFECGGVALGLEEDAAVGLVADPAGHWAADRNGAAGGTKADALDTTDESNPYALHASMVGGWHAAGGRRYKRPTERLRTGEMRTAGGMSPNAW